MVLTFEEEALITTVRGLPPEETTKMITSAEQLSALASRRQIEWSDSWSDEDLADATKASVGHLEEQERAR